MPEAKFDKAVGWTAMIVSAYITRNSVAPGDLPGLIGSVQASLSALGQSSPPLAAAADPKKPAVPIKKSVSDEYVVCLEDGRKFKSIKRHLRERYNMTPEEYRIKWRLPLDYPMVAPGYAKKRSKMAKSMGLGHPRTQKKPDTKTGNPR